MLSTMTRTARSVRRAFRSAAVRYLFALVAVAIAFGIRLLLERWTGAGAPFVLFFGATLVVSLAAGPGPGLLALVVSLPLAAGSFAIPAGATPRQAAFQAMLYGIDGLVLVYLTRLAQLARRRAHEIIELAPDAYFRANLDGRFVDVNEAACRLLGYGRDELVGKAILDTLAPGDAGRLAAVRDQLLKPGPVDTSDWTLVRKDGTGVPVEVSANMLPGGRWQAFVRDIGDRTRAEAERQRTTELLRRSEEQFRLTFEEAPIGVALVGLDGRFVRVNRALCEILGYSAEELQRLTYQELTPPEERPASARMAERVYAGEAARYQLEKHYLRKDGSKVPVSVNGSIVSDRDGRPLHYIAQIEDITERRRAQEVVRQSEEKFSGIVSISADAIISIDEDQKITVFNTGAEKIFGYSRAEVLGQPVELLLPERLGERHRRDVATFAASQVQSRQMAERSVSIRGRRKSGEEFPAEASISNLKIGDTTLLTVALRDTTERVRFEREQRMLDEVGVALAASLDYERTLATIARIAVRDFADWCMVEVADPPGALRRLKVVSADATKAAVAAQLERFPLDRGRPYLTRAVVESGETLLIPRLTPQDVEAAAQSAEHLEALRAVEAVSLLSVPLLLREQLVGTLTFISSKPTRIYRQEDVRVARALAERSALAIENARLYREALRAMGLRDQVLGVVAHDLRNPLSTIALHAAALGRPKPQPERRDQRHKDAIERATRRMTRLIQDLLDVVVLEAGLLGVERAPLSPGALVAEAVGMQLALAAAAAIDLRVQVAPDVPPILGDHDRLLQVFENLIGNALKFTEAGGQVTVGAARGDAEAVFWVADTGRGMTPEDVARVFDRFWQASGRSGRLGAGLGLPITKGIIEAHGGRIWVESAPGQGSTFYFAIPSEPALTARPGEAVH